MFVMMEEVLYQRLLISLDFYRARSYHKLNQQEEKKRFCMIEIKKLMGRVIMVIFPRLHQKFWLLHPGL
jgi:hypothetical protein